MKNRPPTQEQVVLRLARNRGLLHARDIATIKAPTVVLTRLVRAGKLERAARGVYALAGNQGSAQRTLAEVTLRAPRGVICLLTALRVHEIGTQSPFEVWLALPPGVAAPQFEFTQVRIVRLSGDSLTAGIDRIKIDGVSVPVFSPAKTISDCFKFRNKIGLDIALEALREGWRERKASMDELSHYAKVNRVDNVMRPYLEALV